MDDGSLSSLTLIVLLTALHALVAMAQAALTADPAAYARDHGEDSSARSVRRQRRDDDLPRLQITAQLTLTLIRAAILAVATVMVRAPLVALPPEVREQLVLPLSYAVVLVPLVLLVYLLGDLLPSTFGRARAASVAPVLALPMRGLVLVLRPLVAPFRVIEASAGRVAGGADIAATVTDEEILSLVDAGQLGGAIENEEKEMIRSVLEFGETLVREVMVPRLDVTAVEISASLDEALDEFIASGHSRIPVYDEKIDNIKGLLYAKDLLHLARSGELARKSIAELMRPAYFVPEMKRADVLFKEMQARKVHLAVVVDEYGGTAGLVSIEDLVEEIVGDIQDEYDMDEEAEYVRLADDDYTFDASINLDDFNNLMDSELPTEENDTLGGFIFGMIGRVPDIGETLEVTEDRARLVLRVESVEGRRIRKVHVTRVPLPDDAAEADGDEETAARVNGRGPGAGSRAE